MALWEEWLPRAAIVRLTCSAPPRVARMTNPWQSIRGPASAAAASTQRFGWSISDERPTLRRTHVSETDIERMAPRAIASLVRDAVELWLWKGVA